MNCFNLRPETTDITGLQTATSSMESRLKHCQVAGLGFLGSHIASSYSLMVDANLKGFRYGYSWCLFFKGPPKAFALVRDQHAQPWVQMLSPAPSPQQRGPPAAPPFLAPLKVLSAGGSQPRLFVGDRLVFGGAAWHA